MSLRGDHRQFRRVHERHAAQVVRKLPVGETHASSVVDEGSAISRQMSLPLHGGGDALLSALRPDEKKVLYQPRALTEARYGTIILLDGEGRVQRLLQHGVHVQTLVYAQADLAFGCRVKSQD